jgi:atypical dual specificity phosphatase
MGRIGRVYRKIRSRILHQPTFFGWINEGRLAASGLPSSKDQIKWLVKQKVNSILTLTEEPLPVEWFEKYGISNMHISMHDHMPPDIAKLVEATQFLESELKVSRVVLVHCLAGKGRTGTVLAAYLMKAKGMRAKDAIAFLRSKRPGSIEAAQERLLYEYEKGLNYPR